MKSMHASAVLVLLTPVVIGACMISTIYAGETRVNGSGRIAEEEREISGVRGVHLETFGDLRISLGKKDSLLIEAEDNLIEFIVTEVDDGILKIYTVRNACLRPKKPVRYYLTVRELNTIIISSSGDIQAPFVECDDFEIRSSSSGDLTMEGIHATTVNVRMSSSGDVDLGHVNARELDVRISSSGDLTIEKGLAQFQNLTLSSSGDYVAGGLKSQNAHASLSSSGDVHIHVDGHLNASMSSSGSVYYSGDAAVKESRSSSGRVKHKTP